MADQEFREIQLSGKQLVFLFMATTVVSVVIFLCGVLVGRGVQAQKPIEAVGLAAAVPEAEPDSLPGLAFGEPSLEPPPPADEMVDDLSYHRRLGSPETAAENVQPAQATPATPASREPARPQPPAAEPPRTEPVQPAARPEPAPRSTDDGFVVQVTALRDRAAAEALAKRLVSKGYPAFVLNPSAGAPTAVHRVRVGPYPDRRQAEQIMRRLEREEQFKPIITR